MNDEAIYRALAADLTRYATVLAGPDEAADVVSAVVTRVLARRGGLAGLRDPRPYLMRAILNEVRSRHRTRARRRLVALTEGHDPGFRDEPDLVLDLVEELPPRQRAAAFLVYWQGCTPTEAAELMGCRPGTVRRYLHLARRKLEEALGE